MGIDVNNSRRDHPDRNIWYKAKYVLNNKLYKRCSATRNIFIQKM